MRTTIAMDCEELAPSKQLPQSDDPTPIIISSDVRSTQSSLPRERTPPMQHTAIIEYWDAHQS